MALWKFGLFTVCRKTLPQKPQMLRDYLIRLTREYTDGGMDSHAAEEKGVTQGKLRFSCISSEKQYQA
jgi:hypothetical protein